MRSTSGCRSSDRSSGALGSLRSAAQERAAAYTKSMEARRRANPDHYKPAPETDLTEGVLRTHERRRDAGQQIPYWAAAQLGADETQSRSVRRRTPASRRRRGSCVRPPGRSRHKRTRRATRAGPDGEGESEPPGEVAGWRTCVDRQTLGGGLVSVSAAPIPLNVALRSQLAAVVGDEPPSSYIGLRQPLLDGAPSCGRSFVPVARVETIGAKGPA